MSERSHAGHADKLTRIEKRDRDRLELDVQSGLLKFRRAGLALEEIRDRCLHRDTHPTFDAYCKERWGMSRQHAHRLISAATIVEALRLELSPAGDTVLPIHERQARELSRAPEEDRADVWETAVDSAGGDQPTTAQIRAALSIVEEVEGPQALAEQIGEETEAARRRAAVEKEERTEEHRVKRLARADDRLRLAVRWYLAEGLEDDEVRERLEEALIAARAKVAAKAG